MRIGGFDQSAGRHDIDFWDTKMDALFSYLARIEPGTKNHVQCDAEVDDPTCGLRLDEAL
ncbi:hypothetical protein [Bifidobacterium gallicum]|uniref:Uncharacterized protein n=1 Tax=Bifidobacterium gallicum DSM 20093 = LMG 11596 TaxID=561180 RepID=D1NTY4_9BIFI|nr:hypothetical protein [Bifidobacterium gallicum]EFA23188.1 hypothetical protein BIFGAL_03305 [Bifidobacterium gallicum DSM 20093 = LMG 11596]